MLIKAKSFNAGDRVPMDREERIENISFNIYKLSNKNKPDPENIVIFSCLSEFGCETLGAQYVLPKLISENPGKYFIVIGWYGREYFYRHLVDEFWEMKEDHQWLRDYCRAFHHESKNLFRLETECAKLGTLISAANMGKQVLGALCYRCGNFWGTAKKENKCPKCGAVNIRQSMFADIDSWKNRVTKVPLPSSKKMEEASKIVLPNTVGIFARGRKTYGRNLPTDFYVKMIQKLREKGYNLIWLGEKQSTQPCPVEDVVDMSRSDKSKDLELTLAIISKLKFTIQFWTASTRLASMAGVPYLLFESPDQLWGQGQEGYRRKLCDFGLNKLVVAHYRDVCENQELALDTMCKAIGQMKEKDYSDVLMIGNGIVPLMRDGFNSKVYL